MRRPHERVMNHTQLSPNLSSIESRCITNTERILRVYMQGSTKSLSLSSREDVLILDGLLLVSSVESNNLLSREQRSTEVQSQPNRTLSLVAR